METKSCKRKLRDGKLFQRRKGLEVHAAIIDGYLRGEPAFIKPDKDIVVWVDLVPNRHAFLSLPFWGCLYCRGV